MQADRNTHASKANILLVDDRPANLLVLEATLADLGHNLVKALSGEEALKQLKAQEFAVVLLDVQMPGLDGFDTARQIRARDGGRHTPIIFLTAYDDDRFPVEQAYSLGAVDYLVKPLVPVILQAKVAGFVDLFAKTEQIKRQAEELRRVEHREFEQRLAEENARLSESESRFRAIIEHSWDAVALITAEGFISYASPSTARILGYSPDEFVGRNVFALIHPEDLKRTQELFAQILPKPGGVMTARYRLRHKDSSWLC
jgi:PAS domain S-box-containing protein